MLEGGVLEEPKTQPKMNEDVFPKGGGVLEQEENNNTFTKSNVPFPTANDSDDEWKLDKEQSSYHNVLDAFRLALKGINLVKKETQKQIGKS